MLIPTSEKWCKQRCCIQWDINHLVVAKIIQAASIIHLSQDIISYNSAIAACEKGSRWQDTVLVDSAGNLIWQQKLQGSHSVMMTSFGTVLHVLRRHWQQMFFQSLSWIHDSWSISWGTCLLLGECHSWLAACFGLIISPDLKERTLGPNDQKIPSSGHWTHLILPQNAAWLSFATGQFPCPGDLGSGWLGVLGRRTAEEIAMHLTNMTNDRL